MIRKGTGLSQSLKPIRRELSDAFLGLELPHLFLGKERGRSWLDAKLPLDEVDNEERDSADSAAEYDRKDAKMANAKVFMMTMFTPKSDISIATTQNTTLQKRVQNIVCWSVKAFALSLNFSRISFMNIVDMHRRFESALLIVADMIAADTIPVITVGAKCSVTLIMAVAPVRPGIASCIAYAARPRRVGKTAMAAMRTPERSDALNAVFSSFALSKRLIISGPERNVQK